MAMLAPLADTTFGEMGVIVAVVGLGVLVVIYGGVRYWLMAGKRGGEQVKTPVLDRMSAEALNRMTGGGGGEGKVDIEREAAEEQAPADLLKVVPRETDAGKRK